MFGGVPGLGAATGGDPQQMQNLMQQMMNSPMMQVGSICSVLWQYTPQLQLVLVVPAYFFKGSDVCSNCLAPGHAGQPGGAADDVAREPASPTDCGGESRVRADAERPGDAAAVDAPGGQPSESSHLLSPLTAAVTDNSTRTGSAEAL